jgi:hypothetical protein
MGPNGVDAQSRERNNSNTQQLLYLGKLWNLTLGYYLEVIVKVRLR